MKLTKGTALTRDQRAEVLRRFIHRNTRELPCPIVGAPVTQTDAEWIADHAFYVTKAGRLANNRRFAEPHYLAD